MPPFGYGRHHGCGPRGPRHRMRLEDEIVWLERYQRELEQELADVVEKLRRLRRPADGQQAPA